MMSKLLGQPTSAHEISWLTLFFDLIVVAAVSRAAHIYASNPTWLVFAFIVVALTLVYLIWSMTTLELLLAKRETWLRRGIIFVQVCALLVSSLAMSRGSGISDRYGFISLAIAFMGVASLTWLRGREPGADQRYVRPLGISSLITAVICAVGATFPMGYAVGGILIAWIFYPAAALFALVTFSLWGPKLLVKPTTIAAHTLNERFGVLLLIVLGDAFVQLLAVLGTERVIAKPGFLIFTLMLVAGIWMLYYPRLADVPLTLTIRAARLRVAAHYLLALSAAFAIVAFAMSADSGSASAHDHAVAVSWTPLPVAGIMFSILLLTLIRDHTWSISATLHFVTFLLLLGVTACATLTPLFPGESDLVTSMALILIDAIAVLILTKSPAADHEGARAAEAANVLR